MDVSIITFYTGGRLRYLAQCLDSAYDDISNQLIYNEHKIEHHLVLQGVERDEYLNNLIDYFKHSECYSLIVHEWKENIGIGAGLNKILPECTAPLIFKMDDDCKIIGSDFFVRALAIHKRFPNSVFSPQPLGLVNNIGGPQGFSRSIYHDTNLDIYFTLRNVSHVGGFARFSPKNIFKDFKFSPDLINGISGTEDGQLSQHALLKNIPMFYVETGMAVEHNEGLAQQVRYPEYFKNRTGDLETFKKWVK